MEQGGPMAQWKTEQGRRRMEKAASCLPALETSPADAGELHFLTGTRFWYQTAFAVASFQDVTGVTPKVRLYDDGTMTSKEFDLLEQCFPDLDFQSQEVTIDLLDQYLPETEFPGLRERWQNYPNIRKLTDVHVGQSGWKLVMDSDVLFFRKPTRVLDWLDDPGMPLHAVDREESYGYPRDIMESLCGFPIPEKLNVGLCGLKSDDIDWQQLEFWTRSLVEAYGTHYYLEQALVAMLVAGRDSCVLDLNDYVTGPELPEARRCEAVMHHYVAESKKWYFRENWKRFVE